MKPKVGNKTFRVLAALASRRVNSRRVTVGFRAYISHNISGEDCTIIIRTLWERQLCRFANSTDAGYHPRHPVILLTEAGEKEYERLKKEQCDGLR